MLEQTIQADEKHNHSEDFFLKKYQEALKNILTQTFSTEKEPHILLRTMATNKDPLAEKEKALALLPLEYFRNQEKIKQRKKIELNFHRKTFQNISELLNNLIKAILIKNKIPVKDYIHSQGMLGDENVTLFIIEDILKRVLEIDPVHYPEALLEFSELLPPNENTYPVIREFFAVNSTNAKDIAEKRILLNVYIKKYLTQKVIEEIAEKQDQEKMKNFLLFLSDKIKLALLDSGIMNKDNSDFNSSNDLAITKCIAFFIEEAEMNPIVISNIMQPYLSRHQPDQYPQLRNLLSRTTDTSHTTKKDIIGESKALPIKIDNKLFHNKSNYQIHCLMKKQGLFQQQNDLIKQSFRKSCDESRENYRTFARNIMASRRSRSA
jgi:hypothetical protein